MFQNSNVQVALYVPPVHLIRHVFVCVRERERERERGEGGRRKRAPLHPIRARAPEVNFWNNPARARARTHTHTHTSRNSDAV
jgi:hypothetical protein